MTDTTYTGDPGDQGTESSGGGRFGKAGEFASGAYERARSGYNSARERYEDVDFGAITDQVRTYVRSNPAKALLISVGVGFVIGLLLRRDEDDD